MTYDNVGELYYATVRYFENLGNVSQWTNSATSTELDGFPAVTTWADARRGVRPTLGRPSDMVNAHRKMEPVPQHDAAKR